MGVYVPFVLVDESETHVEYRYSPVDGERPTESEFSVRIAKSAVEDFTTECLTFITPRGATGNEQRGAAAAYRAIRTAREKGGVFPRTGAYCA